MQAISFFNFILIFLIFIFNGCSQKAPEIIKCPEKEVYIKNKCPDIIILRKLPDHKKYLKKKQLPIEKIEDGLYYKVKAEDLNDAAIYSQEKSKYILKQDKYIRFYERELRNIKKVCSNKDKRGLGKK